MADKNEKISITEAEVRRDSHHEMDADERILHSLGYKQDLNRSISAFSNFAIAFSCCSVLSGLPPLWGDAMAAAGSLGTIWGWVITSCFTMMVALSLAEICSAYPTTGGLYFWVSKLATADWVPLACWMTGWCNWIGLCCKYIYIYIIGRRVENSIFFFIVGISSVDLGLAQFIAGIVSVW